MTATFSPTTTPPAIVFLGDGPHVVESRADVEIGIVRKTAEGLRYETTGYVAVHVRREVATREQVEAWRFGPR